MHALIIEDEPIVAMSIQDILTEHGFTSFDLVTSTEQALEAAHLKCPDLITADVELNPGSGIEAVEQICGGPPIPVIFITGSPADVITRMPQHPLVVKPFTSDDVSRAVRLALAKLEGQWQ